MPRSILLCFGFLWEYVMRLLCFYIVENYVYSGLGTTCDKPLEYHRATRGTSRSYSSPLGIMSHQFRRKPNKHGKTPIVGIEPRTFWSQSFIPPPRCH
ncbi:hypothetical protein Hanom_Chr04g00306421 [Helianthus anomalus]